MKATLKYTDCLNDGRRVSSVLSRNDVQILRTKSGKSIYSQVTIRVGSYDELSLLVQMLNKECLYGVEVIKTSTINWGIMAIENLLILWFFILFGIFLYLISLSI